MKILAFAFATGVAVGAPAFAIDPPEVVDATVSVSDVRTRDGGIEAVLTNRGDSELRDIRLLIDYVYHWPMERSPGDVSPGKSWPHVVPGPIPPGASQTIRFVPPEGLPTAPGTFSPDVKVLAFRRGQTPSSRN